MRQEYPSNNKAEEESQNYSLTWDKIEFGQ